MDWNDFAKRLTLELSRLPVTSFLILQGPSGLPYVQAMRAEGLLDAEAVGSAFLPRPLAPRQERRLRAIGWEPPDEEERKNWWHQFTLRDRGGRAAEEHLEACALLAGQMVGAFRDVYRVESPLELVYQASRSGPDGGPLALPGLGIALAVPETEGRAAAGSARPARPSGSTLETALTEARERGDQHGYLELLARAVLYLPAPGDPGDAEHQFATAQFGDGTFVLAFTSPEAMDRSLQGQAVHHRQASLSQLSRRWPHPEWQLAVNPGLPSASYLDANALFEPEEPRPPAVPTPPAPTPPAPARPVPTPPVPSDVHVAGPATRTRTRGVKPARGASGRGRAASRPPETPARARAGSAAPSSAPVAAQTPTRPAGDSGAGRPPAPPAPPRRRPEPPATRETPTTQKTSAARETPSDPHGLPVAPLYGGRERAEAAPEAAPVAANGASQIVVMQKVVRPEHVQHYVEGGYDLVAGYVHRLQDVREMKTPAALIRGLGLVYEGSPFIPTDEEIFAIRWPAVKPPLFRRPLGGIDEWSMNIIQGGWVIEKAPFPGSGYAPGDGPTIPEFKIESQKLPHGAELYRLVMDGTETLMASYDADLRTWIAKRPGGPGERR